MLKYTIKIKVKMKEMSNFISLSLSLFLLFSLLSFIWPAFPGEDLKLWRQQGTNQEPRCRAVEMGAWVLSRCYAVSKGNRLVLCSHWDQRESKISLFLFFLLLFPWFACPWVASGIFPSFTWSFVHYVVNINILNLTYFVLGATIYDCPLLRNWVLFVKH